MAKPVEIKVYAYEDYIELESPQTALFVNTKADEDGLFTVENESGSDIASPFDTRAEALGEAVELLLEDVE
jgi:hypothetical protein